MPELIGRTSEPPRLVHITYNSVMRLAWPRDWQDRTSDRAVHACDGLPVVKDWKFTTDDSNTFYNPKYDWQKTDSVVVYIADQHAAATAVQLYREEGLRHITCPTCTVIVDIALSAPEEKPPYTPVEDSQVGRFIKANIEQLRERDSKINKEWLERTTK